MPMLFTSLHTRGTSSGGGSPGGISDPNFSSVVFLSGFEGSDASTTFDDESNSNHTLTAVGNAQIDTAQFKFGSSSLYLDASGDQVTAADSNDWSLGTELYTIEGWFRWESITGTRHMIGQWDEGGNQRSWALRSVDAATDQIQFLFSTDGSSGFIQMVGAVISDISTGTWHHVAVDYDGTTYRMYFNGTMIQSNTTGRNYFASSAPLRIGGRDGVNSPFNGWMDEVRITKGVARYASGAGFTVPDAAFPRS